MIKYPNGKKYAQTADDLSQVLNAHKNKDIIFGHRGMALEDEINTSNEYYRTHSLAVVYKKPTPIQIVKVDYPKRSKAVIREAYFRQPSTTDYNGVFNGYYLDFEAKETKNKRSFPLKNFHQHQIDHFKRCLKQAGICFVIVKFVTLERVFVYPATQLIHHWDLQFDGGTKSIELSEIVAHGFEIDYGMIPALPYLTAVKALINDLKEHGFEFKYNG